MIMECAAMAGRRVLGRPVALLAVIPLVLGACGTRAGSDSAPPSGRTPDAAVATATQPKPGAGGEAVQPSAGAASAVAARTGPSSAGGSSATGHAAPVGGASAAPTR